jgi:hypothetical protein
MVWVIKCNNSKEILYKAETLDKCIEQANRLSTVVIITDGTIEIVGKFGVDTVADGKTPDGIAYDWNKASRIGRVRTRQSFVERERVAQSSAE